MNKGTLALLIGAISLFIAYDIGSGALQGIAEVDQRRLDQTPMRQLVQTAVSDRENDRGNTWTRHANVHSFSVLNDDIVLRLELSEQTILSIGSRMTKAKEVDIRYDLQDEICRHQDLKYLLSRGGGIVIMVLDQAGGEVLSAKMQHDHC